MNLEDFKKRMVQSRWDPKTLEIAIRARFICEYCGCEFYSSVNNYESIQIDHIIPKKYGGNDTSNNLALVCRTCNFIKRNWNPGKNQTKRLTRKELLEITKTYLTSKRKEKEERMLYEANLVRKILNISIEDK